MTRDIFIKNKLEDRLKECKSCLDAALVKQDTKDEIIDDEFKIKVWQEEYRCGVCGTFITLHFDTSEPECFRRKG